VTLAQSPRVPAWQDAIRARCVHPSGAVTEFPAAAVEQSITSRFAQQVTAYPERLAVKDGSRELTYVQLDRAANRVAQALLRELGDAAEPVPLLLPHGADAVVACLGALKAGKFYAPLDPDQPAALSAAIVMDLEARGVLTHRALSAYVAAAAPGVRVLDLDAIDPAGPAYDPRPLLTADALAYVIYTSGTTGPPKGSIENHRNVLQMTRAFVHFHPGPMDRLTMLFRSNFSGSVYDLFGALLNGAALLSYDIRREGVGRLAEWLAGDKITMYGSVPTVFRALTASVTASDRFPHVRVVRFVGDRVLKADVDAFQRLFAPGCVMRVGYGCTEAKIGTNLLVEGTTTLRGETVSVGYVAEDRDVLLLDEAGRVQGADGAVVEGEIAVRSRYLSLGYWRRPDLTAAKFLLDPGGGPERIYLTGDLGRFAPDGALTLIGRQDFQAKVRGHRVEPEAVEAALVNHGGVAEAAVTVRGDRLIAYVTPGRLPLPPAGELRLRLAQSLPDYMVPSTFVVLDALPVTSIGKIDRAALPDPGRGRPALLPPLVAPRNAVEARIVAIWTEVLKRDPVGVEDDFFDVGGDSLRATMVIARVQDAFGAMLPLGLLFERPTIADLATAVEKTRCCPD
jgi:amino acid adenylation domain-containing protein